MRHPCERRPAVSSPRRQGSSRSTLGAQRSASMAHCVPPLRTLCAHESNLLLEQPVEASDFRTAISGGAGETSCCASAASRRRPRGAPHPRHRGMRRGGVRKRLLIGLQRIRHPMSPGKGGLPKASPTPLPALVTLVSPPESPRQAPRRLFAQTAGTDRRVGGSGRDRVKPDLIRCLENFSQRPTHLPVAALPRLPERVRRSSPTLPTASIVT